MRRLLTFLVGCSLALAMGAAGALPANAHQSPGTAPPVPPVTHYVALGDSYASGLGTFAGIPADACPQSGFAYPALLGVPATDFLACPSATSSLTDPVMAAELTALSAVGADATEVSLTVGGNDLGFAGVLTACVNNPGCRENPAVVQAVKTGLHGLSRRITALIEAIHAKAPKAAVFVSGYPRLFGFFTAEQCTVNMPVDGAVDAGPLMVTRGDAKWLNRVTHLADERIRVGAMHAKRHHLAVRFVSVEQAFRGHGLCDRGAAWVNGAAIASLTPTVVPFPQSFHLNAQGEQAYARAFVRSGLIPQS